jgi:hypothetical protein
MSRADLIALIERVEAARGPDRELDAEIARTRLPADADDIARSRGGWSYRVFGPEGWDDEWMEVLPYTGSLDAAVTLYPALPDMIPSCPRKATAAALRARLASIGDDA